MRSTIAGGLVVAGLGLSGCSPAPQPGQAAMPVTVSPSQPAAPAPPPAAAPLPPADALTDVMYRLADPAVPGPAKLILVAGSSAPDAAVLDRFAAALRDGGFNPATFTATDIRWSQTPPGDVVATITVTTANPAEPAAFTFPMEFTPAPDGGWQLTRDTAEMLFAFGNSR